MAAYPIEFVVIMGCLLVAETIMGSILNLAFLFKWITDEKKNKNTPTKSGNNFLATLKTMDLLICMTVIPFTFAVLLLNPDQNLVTCFIKEGLVMFASSGSSVCVMLVSLDRYSAVVTPTQMMFTNRKVKLCTISVFVVALTGMFLPLISLLMGSFESGKAESDLVLPCRFVVWGFGHYYMYDIYYILSFIIALFVVLYCYRSVLKVVRRRLELRATIVPSSSATYATNNARLRKQELKATRLTFAVVLTFLICWGPHVILTVFQLSFPDSLTIDMIQFVCLFMAFLTTVIHPLIYTYERKGSKESATTDVPMPLVLLRRTKKVSPEVSDEQTYSFSQQLTTPNVNIRFNVSSVVTKTSSSES